MLATPITLDRTAPTPYPALPAIGRHRWSNLLFVHWRLPAEAVQPLLPAGLTLDTWDGDAFVGLVPFQLSGVRPWWSPPVPGISSFCETNVRTYVTHRGGEPAVWFFSLDAAKSLAVRIARWKWSLPYYRATMSLRRSGSQIVYSSRRLWPGPAGARCLVKATIGETATGAASGRLRNPPSPAIPGTLDHFLVERYVFYARTAAGKLLKGYVRHEPYQLHGVRIQRLEETLLAAAGFGQPGEFCHATFSDGVDVDVLPLRAVE